MTHEASPNPNQYAQEILDRSQEALSRAVAVVSPETPEASPLDVFPAPNEVRADDAGLTLAPEQEAELRSAAAELGFGRATDRNLSEQGLGHAHVIIEGGQPHKMMAEALLVLDDEQASPSSIIFSASPNRKITSPAEIASAERLLGKAGATEYDVARDIARSLPGFRTFELSERSLPYGYKVGAGFEVTDDTTGQFKLIGTIGKAQVLMMRIDREDYREDGQPKYRNQPGAVDVLNIVEQITGDAPTPFHLLPIAMVTSATYEPSRAVDAAIASTKIAETTGRKIGIASYGTARLAAVKGEEVPAPAPINQLPGELHKMAREVAKLEAVLHPEN